ncbi:class I SAM-dependent methyltransferase [Paenibacillus sp. TRM 82003]|uniref:class I SAM-dependent methyltransferase n=1 Tax=Kineococcus sp. TRM81007 TaxID=2925831 RepID=UPI001F5880C6|nr:class I SAM-dependent methyltransferase [Kineococcus sp. TRM81007]MCI2238890.1 class I SAM-dependent methyltransferase [Kineococcus sp. TRM81007]MCI3924295.1 class I SAM-dependent methyltransferase [Paenibacillus sp. TRM 82003]
MSPADLPGVVPSPNVWDSPDVYELENLAVDRGGVLEAAMRSVRDWAGADVLDVGCGTGFHLPRFAASARSVTGVEPHPPLLRRALERVRGLAGVRVLHGAAGALPLAAASVDVAHARWAYFFGPGCEPGLAELERVVRPGGAAFVVDNDATRSTFGSWFSAALPGYDQAAVDRFFARRGWAVERLDVAWEFERREDLEAVVRIEFAPAHAERFLAGHAGTVVDYAVVLRWRRF